MLIDADTDSIEKKPKTNYLLVLGLMVSLILLYRMHHKLRF